MSRSRDGSAGETQDLVFVPGFSVNRKLQAANPRDDTALARTLRLSRRSGLLAPFDGGGEMLTLFPLIDRVTRLNGEFS